MLLSQGRYWRVRLAKGRDAAVLALGGSGLPDELRELRELRIDVPLDRWNAVLKHADSDRKLLGGVLLDFATAKEQVARVIASDRLLVELQRVVRDATVVLVEEGLLVLAPAEKEVS